MNHSNLKDAQPVEGFLPDFCPIRAIFVVVISAELLAMILALAGGKAIGQFWTELSLRSLYVQWIALCSSAVLCLLRDWFNQHHHLKTGLVAWLSVMVVAAVVSTVAHYTVPSVLIPVDDFASLLVKTLAITGIIAAMALRYLYENYEQQQRVLAESRAQYQALQARIRPHFLFNSMNTIASLTRVDPALAESVVHDLSDLFRVALSEEGQGSTIGAEIDLCKRYMRIEQQRLGERLVVLWDVEAIPMEQSMPLLTLQPLLENAVYHGIEPSIEGGEVVIRGQRHDAIIKISIFNTMPVQVQHTRADGANMALDNIRSRLLSVYGEQAKLDTSIVEDGYLSVLHIPVDEAIA